LVLFKPRFSRALYFYVISDIPVVITLPLAYNMAYIVTFSSPQRHVSSQLIISCSL